MQNESTNGLFQGVTCDPETVLGCGNPSEFGSSAAFCNAVMAYI